MGIFCIPRKNMSEKSGLDYTKPVMRTTCYFQTLLYERPMIVEYRFTVVYLQESHTAGVVAIRNKIVTSKELLEKRTEERQSVEIHLQDLQTKLQEKRQEEASFIATANQRMIAAQEDQSNYVQESVVIEKEITEHSSLLSQLQNEFEKEKNEFNALEKLDSQDIALLKKSIDDVTVELALVQPECDELESKLNELMEELRDASEEYKLVQDKVGIC